MAMVFHGQSFVASLPHRQTLIGDHRMTSANPASPTRRNGVWRHIGRGLAIAASMAVLAGCEDKNAFVAPPPPKVDVATPVQRAVTRYIEATGNTAPIKSVDLVARVQGFLQTIDYQDGAFVRDDKAERGIVAQVFRAALPEWADDGIGVGRDLGHRQYRFGAQTRRGYHRQGQGKDQAHFKPRSICGCLPFR